MKQEVRLFINDKEVEFSQPPEINFVYQKVDYTNPTVVKNSYTKSLEIEGTPQNNRIFNSIFNLDRVQANSEGYFNPAKRVSFQLFENGDIMEQGYVKLDEVRRENGRIIYALTLFGGLGDFFYGLSYSESNNPDEGGNELTLGDLTYRNESDGKEIDLDFTINRQAIKDAWDNLGNYYGYIHNKWDIINFAPCYNGYPEKLDADKVLVDVRSSSTINMRMVQNNSVVTVNGFPTNVSGFTPYEGRYAFVKAGGKLTDLEMKDLRSYTQRPCISVRGLFNGIKNSTKFELDLDRDFFNYDNPYWMDSWITLPLLSNLDNESENVTTSFSVIDTSKADNYDYRLRLGGNTPLYESVSEVSVTFTPVATYKQTGSWDDESVRAAAASTKFYPSFYTGGQGSGRYKYGALTCQLIGFDSNGSAVAGSDIYVCTNKIQKGNELKSATLNEMGYESIYGAAPIFDYGYFIKGSRWSTSAWDLKWYQPITLKLSTTSTDVRYVVLRFDWVNSSVSKNMYPSTYRSSMSPTNGKPSNIFHSYNFNTITASISTGNLTVTTPSDLSSGAKISKKKLLGSLEATPCDLLLSYCKLFNLYFEKDLYEDKIYIRHRGNFYDGKTINLEKLIDKGKDMTLTPLSFENKWYSFNYDEGEGDYLTKYKEKYSSDFGQQKIDTGYNFDSDINNLLEDNAFKNGISCLENSPYYHHYMTNFYDDIGLPPFLFNQKVTYSLYNNSTMENKEIDLLYPASADVGGYNQNINFLDAFDKLQFRDGDNKPTDGAGVLCFFNGFNDEKDYDDAHYIWLSGSSIPSPLELTYRITDDLQQMITLNGKPCWLWTQDDSLGIPITKLPHFGRYTGYKDANMNYIGFAWDFGFPKELYIPDKKYGTSSIIYNRFWKKYISDLYDNNTRILSCYVKMQGRVLGDWLKHFYWFDNSLWVLTKITDYNITSFDTVLCEFVRVWDTTAYTDKINFSPILTLTPSTTEIPASGGTVTVEVYISDGGSWGSEYDGSIITANPTRSSGGVETTVVTLQIAANTGSSRTFTYSVEDSYDRMATVTFHQAGESILTLSPASIELDYGSGATGTLTVASDGDYNITINDN